MNDVLTTLRVRPPVIVTRRLISHLSFRREATPAGRTTDVPAMSERASVSDRVPTVARRRRPERAEKRPDDGKEQQRRARH